MIAYKGFEKNISCRSYQFKRYGINETTEANCRQNGFHCAENPLDCLVHYPNWRNSRYFVVKAFGDLDEDDRDTKISCTKMELNFERHNTDTKLCKTVDRCHKIMELQ